MEGGAQFFYMAAALLFIFGLKRLSGVKTARSGNAYSSLGMAMAIGIALYVLADKPDGIEWWVLGAGLGLGTLVGIVLATRVQMTSMPELVAFFNGMGGAASACVALAQRTAKPTLDNHVKTAIVVSVLIGAVTLSGSLIAYAKLANKLWKNRLGPIGSQPMNVVLALTCVGLCVWAGFLADGSGSILGGHYVLLAIALVLGIGLVIPIGGADMPVVISLLNSYSGLAAAATGFVLQNNLLIIAGSLVGASGLILTRIMCKAMNRSLVNVLFAAFGEEEGKKDETGYTGVKSAGAAEAAPILDASRLVIVAPGYGLAVAQAQHKVREMADILTERGCEVRYAVHPVAGRMPGHMNVLLAEADIPYEQLYDLGQINSEFKNADVAIVLGANDVCNPVANTDPTSPIAGMPVLNVWEARTCMVIKRSLSAGYAGIKNPLFEGDNTLMLFGDAKKMLEEIVIELQEL